MATDPLQLRLQVQRGEISEKAAVERLRREQLEEGFIALGKSLFALLAAFGGAGAAKLAKAVTKSAATAEKFRKFISTAKELIDYVGFAGNASQALDAFLIEPTDDPVELAERGTALRDVLGTIAQALERAKDIAGSTLRDPVFLAKFKEFARAMGDVADILGVPVGLVEAGIIFLGPDRGDQFLAENKILADAANNLAKRFADRGVRSEFEVEIADSSAQSRLNQLYQELFGNFTTIDNASRFLESGADVKTISQSLANLATLLGKTLERSEALGSLLDLGDIALAQRVQAAQEIVNPIRREFVLEDLALAFDASVRNRRKIQPDFDPSISFSETVKLLAEVARRVPPLAPEIIHPGPAVGEQVGTGQSFKRAQGGPLTTGDEALVGEEGPEIFVPIPVKAFADGGVVGGASGLQATLSGAASVLGKVGDPRAAAAAQGIGAAAGILGAFGGSGGGQGGSGLGGSVLGSFGILGGSLFGTDKNGAPRTLESLLEERVPFFSEFLDVQESLNESFFGQEEAHQEALTEEQDLQNKTRSQWMEFSSSAIAKSMGAAQNIASALMQSGSKKMFAVGKSIAIAQAVLDTAQGAIGAYAAFSWIPFVGPALGAAAAAEAIKMGRQRIKQIQGQQFGTAANVSPGDTPSFPTAEDVKKLQGGMPTLGGARSDAQTLSITIASDRRVLPEEWVRDHLIPGINETIRDGATLNISFD